MGVQGEHGEPVAIIGMACRFPGAADPAEFNDLIVAGRNRFEPAAGLEGRPLHAALLDDWAVPFGDVDGASSGDDTGPIQKLATEMAALALADAGLREAAGTSRTGLIVASSVPGVCDQVRGQFGVAAGGPYPDAAYHSSLHAVAGAASALQAGLVDLAVAGGVELGINLAWLARQAQAGVLGTDEMRVYAADPSGLLPGEGCAMVVLVRAADARAARVPVYAELAGWSTVPVVAARRDGATGELGSGSMGTGELGPDELGPGELGTGGLALARAGLLRAYERAGVDPAGIQLIEGAGTGTAAGDAAELQAFSQLRQGSQSAAAVGAVSACIGYTRAAAGVASLVKVAVAMAAGTVPPGPGCVRPHPVIESGDARLRWPDRAEPWPGGNAGTLGNQGPRLAAVNSLGTADPAELAGPMPRLQSTGQSPAGSRVAEGVHLVLRRESEAGRPAGRRRRAATETVTPTGPGRHTPSPHTPAAAPPTAPAAPAQPQAAPRAERRGCDTVDTRVARLPQPRPAEPVEAAPVEAGVAEAGVAEAEPAEAEVADADVAEAEVAERLGDAAVPEALGDAAAPDGPAVPQPAAEAEGELGEAEQTRRTPRPKTPGRLRGMSPEVQALLPRVLAGLARLPVRPEDPPAPVWPKEWDAQAEDGAVALAESALAESAPAETAQGETARDETARGETATAEAASAETAPAETASAEAAPAETGQVGTPHLRAAWVQAEQSEAGRAGPGAGEDVPVLPQRVPGRAFAARAVEHPTVFALCGVDRGELAARLDVIAGSAGVLSATDLSDLARRLAAGSAAAGAELAAAKQSEQGPGEAARGPEILRMALTAGTPRQLATRAGHAAKLLRAGGPGVTDAGPGICVSAGAAGAVAVLFPGRADSVAGQSMQLVTSLQALDTLDALDVRPVAAVGYGLGGEIAGLAWAGCLPETEAARLVALCGQALRSCACGPAAMARVGADAETAQALCAPGLGITSGQLHICAYEGPRTHVLTGPAAGIREMARRAREAGVGVEMLTGVSGLHSPAMNRCAAPLRGVFAGTCFALPRRRLFSSVTGRLLTPEDDIARLLTQMVSLPVLFSQAMSAAAEGVDLILAAAPPDADLTRQAASYGVPAVAIPASTRPGRMDAATAQALAALFTAGAVTDLTPFLAPARPPGAAATDTLASKTVPRMRVAEPDAPHPAGTGSGLGERTAARSAKSASQDAGLLPVRPQRHT